MQFIAPITRLRCRPTDLTLSLLEQYEAPCITISCLTSTRGPRPLARL